MGGAEIHHEVAYRENEEKARTKKQNYDCVTLFEIIRYGSALSATRMKATPIKDSFCCKQRVICLKKLS